MTKTCNVCGKKSESNWCFQHKPRKPLSARKGFSNLTKPVKSEEEIRQISEMREFFLQLWKKLPHYSQVSGKYLGSEPLTVFFHHILPKEKYPQACFDEENIILLTLEEHEQVELDMYRYDEVNTKRNYLKKKYDI
jgi:hypothetical protein